MILAVPDVRQSGPSDCGDACLRAVLSFYGLPTVADESTPRRGLEPGGVERLLEKAGLLTLSGSMTLDDIRHYTETRRPVIVLVTWPGEADSHWCVCRGIGGNEIYLQDPEDGQHSVSLDGFRQIWHDDLYPCWGVVGWVP